MNRILVIGGGAAGFFAAVNAARLDPQARVTIIEKTGKLLSKVLVSGGGRCNVTHACFDPAELCKFYPRGEKQLRQVFSRFHAQHTVDWFNKRGITLKQEADGRMFPVTDDSSTIADCLLHEAEHFGVQIRLNTEAVRISFSDQVFHVQLKDGSVFTADRLLIAAGGHAKSAAYDFIRSTGHTIVEPVPSLFTFNMPADPVRHLMGVAVDPASVHVAGTKLKQSGPLLITHWGMSGPAVLKTSAWGARELASREYRFDVLIAWLSKGEDALREELSGWRKTFASKQVLSQIPGTLPRRFWDYLLHKARLHPEMRWGDLSNKQINALVEVLVRDKYSVSGKTTFKEEFVTCGGVSLSEVDFRTMQSKIIPGLFFAGEVLDIDGVTGGFNFQSAWTTGWLAACGMTGKADEDVKSV